VHQLRTQPDTAHSQHTQRTACPGEPMVTNSGIDASKGRLHACTASGHLRRSAGKAAGLAADFSRPSPEPTLRAASSSSAKNTKGNGTNHHVIQMQPTISAAPVPLSALSGIRPAPRKPGLANRADNRSVQDVMSARLCKPLPSVIRIPLLCLFIFALVRSTLQHAYLQEVCSPFCARQFSASVPSMNLAYSVLQAFIGMGCVTALLVCKRRHCLRAEKEEHTAVKVFTALSIAAAAIMCLAYFATALPYIFRMQRFTRVSQCIGGVDYFPEGAAGKLAGAPQLMQAVWSDPAALGPATAQRVLSGPRDITEAQRQAHIQHKAQTAKNTSWAHRPQRSVYYHSASTEEERVLLHAAAAPSSRTATSASLRAAAAWQQQVPGWSGHVCVALVQGTGWPADVLQSVQEATLRFTEAHGYHLVVDQATSLVTQHGQWPAWNSTLSRAIPDLPHEWMRARLNNPKMAKLALTHWLLSGEAAVEETGGKQCDWALTLDRDAIITNPHQGIEKLLAAAPHAVFHVAQDPLYHLFPFNSGVQLVARHPWVLAQLQRAWVDDDFEVRNGKECTYMQCSLFLFPPRTTVFRRSMDRPAPDEQVVSPTITPRACACAPPLRLELLGDGFLGGLPLAGR